jgi:hypothetical protein
MTALKERIEKTFGRGFDYEYIRRLTGKVRNGIVVEVDRAQIEPRLASLRENYRLMRDELLKIVYWKPGDDGVKPLAKDKVEAAKNVVMCNILPFESDAACLLAPLKENLQRKKFFRLRSYEVISALFSGC